MPASHSALDMPAMRTEARSKWGWFVALGVVFLVLGSIAFGNLMIATIASVLYIGALMVVAGGLSMAHAFQVKSWASFFAWLVSGLFYVAAGVIAFQNPLLTASTLTLILAITLIASGLMRIWSSLQLRPQSGWGWVTASGLVTLLTGIVFVLGWPINTLWLLGMMLAIDLIFQGVTTIALGFALKSDT